MRSVAILVAGRPVVVQVYACAHCGGPFDERLDHAGRRRHGGRTRIYCSRACRQAHRIARAAQPGIAIEQLSLDVAA